jgi:hypothetical protein
MTLPGLPKRDLQMASGETLSILKEALVTLTQNLNICILSPTKHLWIAGTM